MRTYIYTNSVGQDIEIVEVEDGQGGATQMTKSHYDELKAREAEQISLSTLS